MIKSNVKDCASSRTLRSATGPPIATILGALAASLFVMYFFCSPREQEPSGTSSRIEYLCIHGATPARDSGRCLPPLSLLQCIFLCTSFVVLSVGIAYFWFISFDYLHYHSYFSSTFYNCYNEWVTWDLVPVATTWPHHFPSHATWTPPYAHKKHVFSADCTHQNVTHCCTPHSHSWKPSCLHFFHLLNHATKTFNPYSPKRILSCCIIIFYTNVFCIR